MRFCRARRSSVLVVEGDRVVGEERLLMDRKARFREVVQGPEGALYLLTDDSDGELLKLTTRAPARGPSRLSHGTEGCPMGEAAGSPSRWANCRWKLPRRCLAYPLQLAGRHD